MFFLYLYMFVNVRIFVYLFFFLGKKVYLVFSLCVIVCFNGVNVKEMRNSRFFFSKFGRINGKFGKILIYVGDSCFFLYKEY